LPRDKSINNKAVNEVAELPSGSAGRYSWKTIGLFFSCAGGSYIVPLQLCGDLECEPKTAVVELKTSAVAALIFPAH
jgi:hypothetical protein